MSTSSEERESRREAHAARLARALHERIYLVGALPPSPCGARASFLVSGQTGRVYTSSLPIAPAPETASCNCIDQRIRKTVCKHLLFLCARVFKLPEASLSAPVLPRALANRFTAADAALTAAGSHAAPPLLRAAFADAAAGSLPQPARQPVLAREPAPDDDCPICYDTLLPEPLSYCLFGCGRPVHGACFERYEQALRGRDEEAKCVLCRVPWRQREGSAKPIGRGGVLVGRRVVDLSEELPFMFEEQVPVPRRTAAPRRKRPASAAGSSWRRRSQRKGEGDLAVAPRATPGVAKRRSGRATAEARAAAVQAREVKAVRVTRAGARVTRAGARQA